MVRAKITIEGLYKDQEGEVVGEKKNDEGEVILYYIKLDSGVEVSAQPNNCLIL